MKLRALLILATMVLGGMLLSGVVLAKNKTGDSNPNILNGTNSTDYIRGKGGGDDIGGKKSRDFLWGNNGNDTLHGGDGHDHVSGDNGDQDVVYGDAGNDKLWAENEYKGSSFQAAQAKGGRKADTVLGGRGNDTIRAKDGTRDIIRGGPGYDKAYVDKVDKVEGVEKEVVPGGGGDTGGGPPQCNDGIDNDNQGKPDFPDDPGCTSPTDNTESPNPKEEPKKQCNDGIDNDNDEAIDMQDPGCDSATDDTESPNPQVANNNAPVANNDELTTKAWVSKDINVITNDTDVDGDNLSVSDFTQPSHGTVTKNPDGTLKYTPDPSLECDLTQCPDTHDSFDYTVSDGNGGTDAGTVNVTVEGS